MNAHLHHNEKAGGSQKAAQFHPLSAYLSGGVCGRMWMPEIMGGLPINKSIRGVWGFWHKGDTFRDALNGLLMREGGDFQNAGFTADTVLRIERRRIDGQGRYRLHVWERLVSELPCCAELVNADAYTGDFMGDCE